MQISSTTVQIIMDVINIVRKSVSVYSSAIDSSANITMQKVVPDSAMSELWTIRNLSPDSWLDAGNGEFENLIFS